MVLICELVSVFRMDQFYYGSVLKEISTLFIFEPTYPSILDRNIGPKYLTEISDQNMGPKYWTKINVFISIQYS